MINKFFILIFAFYLSKLNTATASYQLNDGLVETKFFTRNCRVNNCTEALDLCVLDRCNTVSQCQICMDRNHPECSECSRDIFENQPEIIGDKEFQLCDTEDELQVAACRYYCRGVFRQSGECVPYLNNLDVCDCSSNTVATTTQRPIESTSTTTRIVTTTEPESELIRTFGDLKNEITSLELLSNGYVAAGYDSGLIKIWNPSTGLLIRNLRRHYKAITDLKLLPNGYLVSASEDENVFIWDVEDGSIIKTIIQAFVSSAIETLQNGTLVTGTAAGNVRFYNDGYNFISAFSAHGARIAALQTLQNGYLASCSWFNRDNVKIWDLDSAPRLIFSTSGHTAIVTSLDIIGNGDLVSGSTDRSVRVWDPLAGNLKKIVSIGFEVNSLRYLNDDKIAVAGKTNSISILNSSNWSQTRVLQSNSTEFITSLELLSNGNLLSGSADGFLRVWRI